MRVHTTVQNQAVRYLQYCVHTLKNEDQAIHNLLLSLYVQQTDDAPLLQFLRAEVPSPRTLIHFAGPKN